MRSRPARLSAWLALSGAVLALDYVAGPYMQFPIAFVLPVTLCAWFDGFRWAAVFAVGLPLARLFFVWKWDFPFGTETAIWNAVIRTVVLVMLAYLVARTARQTRELAYRVDQLEGLLPICSHCKKIRDRDDAWQPLERYISARSEAQFTHGICPDCVAKHYDEFRVPSGS